MMITMEQMIDDIIKLTKYEERHREHLKRQPYEYIYRLWKMYWKRSSVNERS